MFVFLLVTDGLIDCQDPECCEAAVCKSSQLCATVARPVDILLQRQPPASTASFFQKMRFIIEEGSLQRYAKNTAFNERQVNPIYIYNLYQNNPICNLYYQNNPLILETFVHDKKQKNVRTYPCLKYKIFEKIACIRSLHFQ